MIETTKSVELKLYTFIALPKGVNIEIPMNISFSLAYTQEEAMNAVFAQFSPHGVTLKPTGSIDLQIIKKMFGGLFETPTIIQPPSIPIIPAPIETIIVEEPSEDKRINEFSIENLQFIINNKELCKKLTKNDVSALKRIIKKLNYEKTN